MLATIQDRARKILQFQWPNRAILMASMSPENQRNGETRTWQADLRSIVYDGRKESELERKDQSLDAL